MADDVTKMAYHFDRHKKETDRAVLLFDEGEGFYEAYFEDASLVSRALKVPMFHMWAGPHPAIPVAAIPVDGVKRRIRPLLRRGHRVAFLMK